MKKRSINTIFASPYILNGVVWLFVLLVYQLGWSNLCPHLSVDMSIFIAVTVFVSIAFGVVGYYKGLIDFVPVRHLSISKMTILLSLLYILFFAEVAVGGIPLLDYLRGNVDSNTYKEFGLPFVHVIVVNGLSCLIIYAFYGIRSMTYIRRKDEKDDEWGGEEKADKKKKRKLWLLLILCLLPFAMMFNRGAIMSLLVGIFILVMLTTSKPMVMIIKIIAIGFIIFFGFGWFGNMRMGSKFDNVILTVGGATTEFKNSGIPTEFFWGYLYIATPLANTQNTVERTGAIEGDSEELEDMIFFEFIPEIITKRVKGENSKSYKRHRSILLTDDLNATSVYGRAYKYLGWPGMWLMYAFTLLFIFVNLYIVSKRSKWYVPVVITLDMMMIMNLFDNMYIFMGMVPQLFIFLILYFSEKFLKGKKKLILRD